MSKGPTPRHSKSPKPVTIDLDAKDVTPRAESQTGAAAASNVAAKAGSQADAGTGVKSGGPAEPGGKVEPKTGIDAKAGTDAKQETTAAPGSDSAKPETPSKPAASPAAGTSKDAGSSARPAWSGVLLGGLAGGAIALAGSFGLQSAGLMPAPGMQEQSSALAGDVAEMKANLTDLSRRLDVLSARRPDAELSEIAGRVMVLEQGLSSSAHAASAESVLTLENKLAEIAHRLENLEAASDTQTAAGGAAEVSTVLAELGAQGEATASTLGALEARAAALENMVATLEKQQQGAVSLLEARLSEAEAQLSRPGREINLARAIAASGLKTAIDRGGPFTAELEALASVAPDEEAVAGLRDFAASGVPTRGQLLAGYADVANAMISAMHPVDPEAGIVDRLMSSALSVVKIRKVGDVQGDEVEAIAARLEIRLADGDLEGALAEWDRLPEAAKAATSGFGKDLSTRAKVEKLMISALAPVAAAQAN